MKKWKILALVLVLVLAFTACSNKKKDEPADTDVTEQDANNGAEDSTKDEGQNADSADKEDANKEDANKEDANKEEEKKEEVVLGIKDILGEYGLKAGTCLTNNMLGNANCVRIIKQNFNSITFENDMKPDYILDKNASVAAGDIVVKFNDNTLKLLKWCKNNEMAVRGHTIIWHSQTPTWIFYEDFDPSKALVSRDVMLARMESYIRQVFEQLEATGYSDMIYAYDVVNEAWLDDGTMRDSLWRTTIGDDYLWHAFYFADKYAPEHIELYYNDFNEQFKTEALYNFVQTLKDEEGNYFIDGIGFQAHLYTEDSLDDYFATVDKLASLGIKVNLTELDVCLGSWPVIKPASEKNLKLQGQFYYNLVEGLLKRVKEGTVKMDSLTIWGFVDTLSWRSERNPMLFNMAYKPKYAYYGVMQMKDQAGFDTEE